MSWDKSVTLWCDEEGCSEHSGTLPVEYVRLARQRAGARGWTFKDGKDYCPEHSEE